MRQEDFRFGSGFLSKQKKERSYFQSSSYPRNIPGFLSGNLVAYLLVVSSGANFFIDLPGNLVHDLGALGLLLVTANSLVDVFAVPGGNHGDGHLAIKKVI